MSPPEREVPHENKVLEGVSTGNRASFSINIFNGKFETMGKDLDFEQTKPKPLGVKPVTHANVLLAKRYGTDDMCRIWGAEKTFEYSLKAQAASIDMLHKYGIVSQEDRNELVEKANLGYINPERIMEIEEKTGHDVIAINTAWEEQVSPKAAAHINKTRTSADTTETAKALQLKESIEVYVDSLEILRDITLEKALSWISVPHMDQTHNYDALPTVAGRPLVFYAEMLQSDIDLLKERYEKSVYGKWADATGNHHSAKFYDLDGINLQEDYCKSLGINCMLAPAQIPGREFITDTVYAVARSGETMNNYAKFVKKGRSQDVGIYKMERKKKGSSSMPQKDTMGGNPTIPEQTESFCNHARGCVMTSLSSCTFDYGRDLSGSASDRIMLESLFKFADHTARRFGSEVYGLMLINDRSRERVERTYGVVTSENLMNCLTDPRKAKNTMTRKEAHDIAAELATKAYDEKRNFTDVVLECDKITSILDEKTIIAELAPFECIGESKKIVKTAFDRFHGKKAFA